MTKRIFLGLIVMFVGWLVIFASFAVVPFSYVLSAKMFNVANWRVVQVLISSLILIVILLWAGVDLVVRGEKMVDRK